jgi:hypothetical protein
LNVRTEPDVGRTVERGRVGGTDERLVAGIVARKILDLEGERLVRLLVEVEQLDHLQLPEFKGLEVLFCGYDVETGRGEP